MHRLFRKLGLMAAAVAAVVAVACGPREERLPETGATLEGTVTYGKEKLQAAMIIVAGNGSSSTGHIDEDGRYKVDNVPLGEVTIGVNTAAAKGELVGKMMAQSQGKAPRKAPKVIDVPAKFADPNTSGVKTTVKEGQNTFDIVLTK